MSQKSSENWSSRRTIYAYGEDPHIPEYDYKMGNIKILILSQTICSN